MSLRLDSDQEWDMLLPGALLRDPARRGSSHLSQRSLPCTDRTHTHLITDEIFSLLWRVADVKRHRALCSLFCSPCDFPQTSSMVRRGVRLPQIAISLRNPWVFRQLVIQQVFLPLPLQFCHLHLQLDMLRLTSQ